MNNQQQNPNQLQNQAQNLKNAATFNNQYNFEAATEVAQSPGRISQILATQNLIGLEIGTLGQYQGNYQQNAGNLQQNAQNQLEINQSAGQMSQILAKQSQQ